MTLHILWKSHHIFSYDQQDVSHMIADSVNGSLITSFPTTNSLWVILQILWKTVSSDFFLWQTGGGWHCTFSERQFHHVFSYNQQEVSDIAHLQKVVSVHLFLWPTACEWHCTDFVNGSFITSFPLTNSLWVTSQIFWPVFWVYLHKCLDKSLHPT